MRFYSLKEKRPALGQIVLVKFDSGDGIHYYVCEYEDYHFNGEYIFVEASGERYMQIYDEDIIGWMPIEELDKIEVQND